MPLHYITLDWDLMINTNLNYKHYDVSMKPVE